MPAYIRAHSVPQPYHHNCLGRSQCVEIRAQLAGEFCVESRGPRLIVTRISALRTPLKVGQIQFAMVKALEKIRTKAVVCTDWRTVDIFAPVIAEAILDLLNVTNHKIFRGGILLNADKATFNLQVERVLRDAGNPNRRCFRDPSPLLDWISESLEPSEIEAARSFLEQG